MPNRCRTFIYLFYSFFFFFHLFGSFSTFVVYLACLCNCFQYISCFKQKRYSLAVFSVRERFFRTLFLQCNADFHLNGISKPSRSVSPKKGIPVPLYSKKRVRGLYFEKCVRFNVICSFEGKNTFELM